MHEAKKPLGVASEQQVIWDDLKIFFQVCERGSVRQAAIALDLNASTVSRRVAALEVALATQLFERHPSGLRLTTVGEEVHDLCGRLEQGVTQVTRRVAGHDQRLEGTLRVTSAEVIGQLTCVCLSEFQKNHPAVTIDLRLSDHMANLQRHEVDVALRVADNPPEDLIGKKIGHAGVGLFASHAYVNQNGSDPRDRGQFFIEWPSALSHKPAFAWLDKRVPERRASARIGSASAALEAVRAGLGISLLGVAQAMNEPNLLLIERLPTSCATPVWLLTHSDLRRTARVRAVMDHLTQAFAAHREMLGA